MSNRLHLARTLLHSWLRATSIPFQTTQLRGSHLIVGSDVQVALHEALAERPPPGVSVVLLIPELLSPHKPTALSAFHGLTLLAGYGTPSPIDRGRLPTREEMYGRQQFELGAFRYTEFHRAPNPSPEVFQRYRKVMEAAVRICRNRNRLLLKYVGYEEDDLFSYARVWTTNFVGLYERQGADEAENNRLLTVYLHQRFYELVGMLMGQQKNQELRNDDTSADELTGVTSDRFQVQPTVATRLEELEGKEDLEDEEEQELAELRRYAHRHVHLNRSSVAKRRASAKAALEKALAGLPHDRLVYLLEEATQNTHLCSDSRREALKRLRAHQQKCSTCAPLAPDLDGAGVEVDEDLTAVDAPGLLKQA